MRRSVADDVGTVLVKNIVNTALVTHGADKHHEIEFGMLPPQLHLELIGVIFVYVEDDEGLGLLCRRLTAQLAADAAAAARNQNDLVLYVAGDLV